MKLKLILLLLTSGTLISTKIPENVFLPTKNFESSYPFITGSTIRSICNHKLDPTESFDPSKILPGDTIFVMVNFLEHFFEIYHPRIVSPYVLVTHHFFDEADSPVPGKFVNYLDDPKIAAWFTHNPDIAYHPKLFPIPIGIANPCFAIGDRNVFNSCTKSFANKVANKKLLYMNIRLETCRGERELVNNLFRTKSFCTVEQPLKHLFDYLHDLARHKFVLSPRGNGLDCYRTWESLMMGAYPIVRTSTLDSLFEELPVVIIQNWTEVTEQFLEEKYKEMSNKKYNLEKLYMPYWVTKIQAIQQKYKK